MLSIVPGSFIGGLVAYIAAWAIMTDSSSPASAEAETRRLTRSTTDRQIAGVCGGLAEYFNVDATLVRVIWAILTIIPGCIVLGIVAYLVAWFIMPDSPATHAVSTPSVA